MSGAILHAIQTIERVSIRAPGSLGRGDVPGWKHRRDEVIHAARLLPAKALLGGESWDAGVMGLVTAVQGALKCMQGDLKLGKGQSAAAFVQRADWQGGHQTGRGSHAVALGLVAAKGLARPGVLRQEQLQLLQDRAGSASLRMRLRSESKPIPTNALQEHPVGDGELPSARARTGANGSGPGSGGLAGDGQATPIVSPGSPQAAGSQRPRPVALPAGMQLRDTNGRSPAVSPMVAGQGGARPWRVGEDGDGAGEGKDSEVGSGEEEEEQEAPNGGGSPGGARQPGAGALRRGGSGSSPRGGRPSTQAGPV